MAKTFFTEDEIEDLFKRGVTSLEIDDNTVLTELAYEKAQRLGVRLVQHQADTPPCAPVRPYISKLNPVASGSSFNSGSTFSSGSNASSTPAAKPASPDLKQRVKDAVIARLGTQVDASLLDSIITRVLNSTGAK
jgi:hypothetical protein